MSNIWISARQTVAGTPVAVQSVKHSISISAVSSLSVAYTANVAAGNCLIAGIGWESAINSVTSVKDSLNNINWTLAGTLKQATNLTAGIYYFNNTLGGASNVTITLSGTAPYLDIAVIEVSGLSGVVDVTSSNTGTGGSVSPGSLTTTAANDFLLAYCCTGGSVTAGASGWTFTELSTSNNGFQYIMEPSIGTYNPSFTCASTWTATAAAFKAL
jgi:hypothetical protein